MPVSLRICLRDILILKTFAILSVALLCLIFIVFFFISYVSVPWGDGIDVIELYKKTNTLEFISRILNGHFPIFPRIITVIDLSLGNLNFRVSALFAIILYLIQFFIVCRYIVFIDNSDWNWWIATGIATTSFATYRLIVISNPINNTHFLVGFFVFLAVVTYSLQRQCLGTKRIALLFSAFCCSAIAMLTLANGILILPIILIIHLRCSSFFSALQLKTRVSCIIAAGIVFAVAFVILALAIDQNVEGYSNPTNFGAILWFYLRALGLPFTGILFSYYPGLILGACSALLALFYLIRFFVNTERNLTHNVAIGLILYSVISLAVVSVFRHEVYDEFFSHGHRYGVFNLPLHTGLILMLGSAIKETTVGPRISNLVKGSLLTLATMCIIGCVFVGNYLIDRKDQFLTIANNLAYNKPINADRFYRIAFYPSIWAARGYYSEFVKNGWTPPRGADIAKEIGDKNLKISD